MELYTNGGNTRETENPKPSSASLFRESTKMSFWSFPNSECNEKELVLHNRLENKRKKWVPAPLSNPHGLHRSYGRTQDLGLNAPSAVSHPDVEHYERVLTDFAPNLRHSLAR